MTTQQDRYPEGYDGQPLSQQLEELGQQLGFYVEEPHRASHSSPNEQTVLRVAVIYHKADAVHWQRLSRHLELLEVPDCYIEWSSLRLTQEAGDIFVERIRTQLAQTHLVLLLVSIDLAEVLVKKSPKLYKMLADLGESAVVFPILLRPVFWACGFPTLEPVPRRAISLWGNQDAAHTMVAKRISGVLEGVKMFLSEDWSGQS